MKTYRFRKVTVLFTALLCGVITQTGFCYETNPTMDGKQMEESEIDVNGQLSLAMLEGTDWLLTRLDNKQSLADDVEVTLSFADGRISGMSACNRYSAQVTEGNNPGEVLIGPKLDL